MTFGRPAQWQEHSLGSWLCVICATVAVSWHAHSSESVWCLQDFESGHLYALEKFWGFHHYTGLPAGCSVTINSKVGAWGADSADQCPSA